MPYYCNHPYPPRSTLGGELVCSDASSGCDDSDDAHEHHPIATSIYSGVRARAPIPGLAHDVSTASEPPMRSPAMPGVDRGAWRAGKRGGWGGGVEEWGGRDVETVCRGL